MTTLRRGVLGAALTVLVAASAACGWRLANAEETTGPAPAKTVVMAPTTTAPVAATVTPPPLPQPIAATAEDYIQEPATEIGRLQIPAIDVDSALFEGISLTSIDRGPSHWPGTAMPGRLGNAVVAGHRVTHSHPFRNLDRLVPGDQATLTTIEGSYVYELIATEVVTPDRVDIVTQTHEYRATFFACHPPGSARFRIVAHWRLVSAPAA